MIRRLLLILTISIFVLSCTKENNAPKRSLGFEFYPLKKGNIWVYDVDSTFYDKFYNGRSTNYVFQLKDSIADTYMSMVGDTVYRFERYKKTADSKVWTYQKTFTRSIHLRSAEENIDNQIFVRFIFPPKLGASWNGNSRNILEKQNYSVTKFPERLEIGNTMYDSVAVVQQSDEFNLIQEDIVSESYAKGIGLIKKEIRQIEKDISSGKIMHGTICTIDLNRFNRVP
ncbi:hypothetical protein Pedsa_0781 [Pseudopedobacter saltans DSM 12145]|uniref:Uncharacterized protein n=1 Tax=Pseudopedobacter saltans (strain ATCC 51119 / DSM 12145 / JCM 21818 / CCUG 39354 / LMG 10337 / NBRC 100064 / NCIMB 13643) TaxID=762903 RepID=F0S956_PSESL|nr:hypothetical protein [Pseudopedobacter saltans]ADY51354.1 hypothetical protein Pedsa_0781 [Pseudopedobacter saltans DSM 12145]